MGRSHGRGAKGVAIVTHAQVKRAKKTPRGLRATSRRQRRQEYVATQAQDDPASAGDTGVHPGSKKGKNQAPRTLEQQIAGVHFLENVPKGTKLSSLRKQILRQVSTLRKSHNKRKQRQTEHEMRMVERQMAGNRRRAEEQAAAAAAANVVGSATPSGAAKKQQQSAAAASAGKKTAMKRKGK
jgi:hypothetical protein